MDPLTASDLDPLVRRVHLAVEPPSLTDTAGDLQRLLRALRQRTGYDSLGAPLGLLTRMGSILRQAHWDIAATLVSLDGTGLLVDLEEADAHRPLCGLAVDVGTTTLAIALVDLETGHVVGERTDYNPQRTHGEDVTSRMIFCEKGGLAVLRQLVVGRLNELIADVCRNVGLHSEGIPVAVIAGNTIMLHILLGLDPTSIRREPYVPVTTVYPPLRSGEVGLDLHPNGVVHCLPAASGYVGSDITAGVVATGVYRSADLMIFVDIGTNGETVLGNREWIVACSGSAGSAFEGCGLEFGMPASPGAIESVLVEANGGVAWTTVAGVPPRGICGSGLISLLAAFLRHGVLDRRGKLRQVPGWSCVRTGPFGLEVIVAHAAESSIGKDIVVTQADIDNLVRDKAALYAGTTILLRSMQVSLGDVAQVLIAGNFGRHLDLENAIAIGLLPDIEREKIRFVGNTALAGAVKVLLSRRALVEARRIAGSITTLELTREPGYYEAYTSALFLPHTDLTLFPSVQPRMTRSARQQDART
jgi:uncharacterized 2Fe-2S/4Fe-4S cluster protein (DUF4445 family)